jgi:BMFP domain-containing protein YqiC
MSDLFDKAILIGMGLEKKAKEVLGELENAGKTSKEAPGSEGLPPRQAAENKVVDEGVRALKEFVALVKSAKEKLEKDVSTGSEKVFEKLNVATQNDIELIKEMARVAREKVDKLEKRVAELEARIVKDEQQGNI